MFGGINSVEGSRWGSRVSVFDHSLFSKLFDDGEEISFFVSLFGGGVVLVFEGVAHSVTDIKHFSVSSNLLGGLGHNEVFFKNASAHVINVRNKSVFEGTEFSKGGLEVSFNTVEGSLGSIFLGLEFFHVSSASSQDFFHHAFASVNGRWVDEFIFFRGSHLGEEGDEWSVGGHHVDVGTSGDELHGVLGEFEEGSFTRDHLVKEVHSVSKNFKGEFMSVSLGDKLGVFGFSDGGDLGEGGGGVDDVFSAVSEVDGGFVEGGGAGVVMLGSSLEGVVTVFDFLSSEDFFVFTVGLLDGPHGVVFGLFGSDLLVEFLDDVEDGGEGSAGGDHGLDLGEHTGVGDGSHGLESLFFDGHGGDCEDADK
jgi:hypothetical protein